PHHRIRAMAVRDRGATAQRGRSRRVAGPALHVRHARRERTLRRALPAAVSKDGSMTATVERVEPYSVDAATARNVVELRNASRWYGNVVAVNDVSFTLGPGITGLLGPNGAGKTTILHMLAGLLRPSAGEVLISGMPA